MAHFTYFVILLASIAFPLALSFDKKVHFYTRWKAVFLAMLLPAVVYIIWDSWFTRIGVWEFNENYISGVKAFGLPVEEILFFFVVPYCCTFIYECIKIYFPKLKNTRLADYVLACIAIFLFISGVVNSEKLYTAVTFLSASLFISVILVFRKYFREFNSSLFLISYLIILIPFLIVNGFLTSIPVVIYNYAENLGLRIFTIPAEDIFYGMLLVLMNIILYEKL